MQVWNTRTNAAWSVLTLRGHLGPVRCLHMRGTLVRAVLRACALSLSPSLSFSLSLSLSCSLLLSLSDGSLITVQLVSGSSDHTIRVWELIDGPGWRCGSCRLTITGHDGRRACEAAF
jgi:WD40 repeat protein